MSKEILVELLKQAPLCGKTFDLHYSDGTIEKIADYLLANGVIVPPCKVGDVVYNHLFGEVKSYVVTEINFKYTADGLECEEVYAFGDYGLCFVFENIGKTVFLTREEAEAKFKENET